MKSNAQIVVMFSLVSLTGGIPACKSESEAKPRIDAAHEKVREHSNAVADSAGEVAIAPGNGDEVAAAAAKVKGASLVPRVYLTGAPTKQLLALMSGTVSALERAKRPKEFAEILRGVTKDYDVSALRAAARLARFKGQGASAATRAALKSQKVAYKKLVDEMGKKYPEEVGPAAAAFAKAWGIF